MLNMKLSFLTAHNQTGSRAGDGPPNLVPCLAQAGGPGVSPPLFLICSGNGQKIGKKKARNLRAFTVKAEKPARN